ncbi:MAG: hypothetical protein GY711_28020 [bacterium]|nr:hypothetical protein [bacterium]
MGPWKTVVLTALFLAGQVPPGPAKARAALRPSLVAVSTRLCTYLDRDDWRRVELTASVILPLARALDKEHGLGQAQALEQGLEQRDDAKTLRALTKILYWDTRDLLQPISVGRLSTAKDTKSRLLKARQALTFLTPLIKAKKVVRKGKQELGSGKRISAALEKTLDKPLNYLPTERKYGKNKHWAQNAEKDVQSFLLLLEAALPELHGRRDRETAR